VVIKTWSDRFRWLVIWLAGTWLAICMAWLIGAAFFSSWQRAWWWTLYLGVTAVMSPICLAAYGIDKQQAADQQERISERMLHLLALLGGWPGALLGQQLFRHKTKKVVFRMVLWLILALHLALICLGLYWLMFRGSQS
jgi:uncharacterized membrane protein YsdA (DUF1294 family)